jgi:hypothetical protein
MNMKGMPIYGVGHRPYKDLSDDELASQRAAALKAETDMRLIIDLNTETQLRSMLSQGAKIMKTPTARRSRR